MEKHAGSKSPKISVQTLINSNVSILQQLSIFGIRPKFKKLVKEATLWQLWASYRDEFIKIRSSGFVSCCQIQKVYRIKVPKTLKYKASNATYYTEDYELSRGVIRQV